ncbi:alpha-amylase [Bremerella cremea]|uniref:1,4-alpha-glucan branching enzyme n=1 Tax=Bremerella cremea TaxID=1031537 RepID=A0A368KNS7_9BACT|nr:alpha-amylase family glycosyl hydrolase [Bremerella cremea]RCS42043.1 alpha-amylase [Bremerella cremea]
MATHHVTFIYYFGVSGDPFPDFNATLEGSWNAVGEYSDDWSVSAMEKIESEDGGYCFKGAVQLDDSQTGQVFKWGVRFHRGETSTWAIPQEIKSHESRARFRSFRFDGAAQTERFYLTHCRHLGANKYKKSDGTWGICFRVWAPKAKEVELVFGSLWNADDPTKTPLSQGESLLREKLAGGYIGNDSSGIDTTLPRIAMIKREGGIWETPADHDYLQDFEALNHKLYMYRIKRDDDSQLYRTDLYSRCQAGFGATDPATDSWGELLSDLAGRVSCSVTVDPDTVVKEFEVPAWPEAPADFIPTEEFWEDEFTDKQVPQQVQDLIIYELHLGALGFGSGKPGTLKDAMALLDHIVGLNANAVELLPLSEFAGGAQNWGYATSHYFAIEYGGGGRDQFKHFVKECHRRGLAVIMDVVYNHYDHDAERAERYYDSPVPERDTFYWYEGRSDDYRYLEHRGWGDKWYRGGYVKNQSSGDAPAYHEEMVRAMFVSSAVALAREFHIDGFRVDQTTSIHGYNRLRANDAEVPNANIYGAKLLREFGRTVRLFHPGIMLMAEDHSEWDEVLKPVEQDGMGFDGRWYSDFYHHLAGDTKSDGKAKLLLQAARNSFGGGEDLKLDSFSGALWNSQFQKIVYNESHDEAGNSSGPFWDPTWKDGDEESKKCTSHRTIKVAANAQPLIGETRKYAEARCRFAWGITALSAGTPMFLFGEEVGAEKRFKYSAVIDFKEDLHGMREGIGKSLYRFYSDVNKLRLDHPALRSRNIDIVHVRNDTRVVVFRRWKGDRSFLIFASLADQPYANGYIVNNSRIESGPWREVFNSDSFDYGGDNVGNGGQTLWCDNGRIEAVVPFNGFVVFSH